MCFITDFIKAHTRTERHHLVADQRAKLNGWAPGTYHSRCFSCDEEFIGGERAIFCADCAYGTKEHP
ncbi:hypothetical protein [Bradyrhizobium sp. HKCCYLS20291]|uniref:hypothetical protein n=1 Tax=Bradyrhizobium sp. HKCCYLS20291 TaxID=3420766 RepID=UPI003EBD9777